MRFIFIIAFILLGILYLNSGVESMVNMSQKPFLCPDGNSDLSYGSISSVINTNSPCKGFHDQYLPCDSCETKHPLYPYPSI